MERAVNETVDIWRLSSDLETALLGKRDGRKSVIEDFPWITLPEGYSFKVTFPFNGAAARFRVCKTSNPKNDVSIYLDTKDVLGYFGSPYWECYPSEGDVARFAIEDTEGLVAAIVKELSLTTDVEVE